MLNYVNGFSCAHNPEEDTVVIHFKQKEPLIIDQEDGSDTEIKLVDNDVSSINNPLRYRNGVILRRECLIAYAFSITQVCCLQ